MIHSYPSIYNLGHAAVADLTKGPVIVEEKVDGSQLSFRINPEGELEMRSKGAMLNIVAPEGMFQRAVMSIISRRKKLKPGYVYRGEYLNAPHHNALTYSRAPNGNVIIFDITNGQETYLSPDEKRREAEELGLETVPVLYRGMVSSMDQFRSLLETQSVLGGQKIEGVVIKPERYDLYGRDKKVVMGKFVSEAFKEVNSAAWDSEHRTKGTVDILEQIRRTYGTPARWSKAVIHLRESGKIQDAPQDIGQIIKEVPEDIAKECESELKDILYAWAWPQIRRMVTRGIPEWYKEELLKRQFSKSI